MEISKERLEELKKIFKEEYGKELTDEEAYQVGHTLVGLAEICYKSFCREQEWKQRLEKSPEGFALEGEGRTCCICEQSIHEGNAWYDKNGIKCMDCQAALDKRAIPQGIAKKRDSWYSSWDLQSKFKLHSSTIRKMVREGELKERVIKTKDGKGIHAKIYLKKDNPSLL